MKIRNALLICMTFLALSCIGPFDPKETKSEIITTLYQGDECLANCDRIAALIRVKDAKCVVLEASYDTIPAGFTTFILIKLTWKCWWRE